MLSLLESSTKTGPGNQSGGSHLTAAQLRHRLVSDRPRLGVVGVCRRFSDLLEVEGRALAEVFEEGQLQLHLIHLARRHAVGEFEGLLSSGGNRSVGEDEAAAVLVAVEDVLVARPRTVRGGQARQGEVDVRASVVRQ